MTAHRWREERATLRRLEEWRQAREDRDDERADRLDMAHDRKETQR